MLGRGSTDGQALKGRVRKVGEDEKHSTRTDASAPSPAEALNLNTLDTHIHTHECRELPLASSLFRVLYIFLKPRRQPTCESVRC